MEGLYFARAKVNLSIDVLARQKDGYHQVAMVLQSINLADKLYFKVTKGKIKITCSNPVLSCGEENLVYKAALLLRDSYAPKKDLGVEISLEKNIPLEAGLAGGSSDAAATLTALNHLWKLNLNNEQLLSLGLKLGADVPFCLTGGTVLARGIGEKLTSLSPLNSHPLVLVKPPFGLSTAKVYKSLDLNNISKRPNIPELLHALEIKDIDLIVNSWGNVLEEGVGEKYQEIIKLKEDMLMLGSKGALMSGSGPTVFGLFDNFKQAQETANYFIKKGYWSCVAKTCSQGVVFES